MKFENTDVWGFKHAIRGMRNPMNSWDKSDSKYVTIDEADGEFSHLTFKNYIIGDNDLDLMQRLIKGGSEHRKFMRQLMVSVDITAPSYFMAEFDTYKIGITRNSCSFMHKGVSKPFEIEDFEIDDERIIEILTTRKPNKYENEHIIYPYETDEYRIYTTQNGKNRQYKVFKNGRVVALPYSYTDTMGRTRMFDEYEVKPSITKHGYWECNLGGRPSEKWMLHRLIATVWLNNDNDYDTVDHLDSNKNNNSVENLEWVSRKENIKREYDNNLMRQNNLRADYENYKKSSKLSVFDKIKLKNAYEQGVTQKELSIKYNINQSTVSAILLQKGGTSNNTELFDTCYVWEYIIKQLNELRNEYLETKDYRYFRMIRQLLPMGYLYKSTITMNYENLYTIIHQREGHKLTEWQQFIDWAHTLPYAKDLIFTE